MKCTIIYRGRPGGLYKVFVYWSFCQTTGAMALLNIYNFQEFCNPVFELPKFYLPHASLNYFCCKIHVVKPRVADRRESRF